MRVLLIEPDAATAQLVASYLQKKHLEVVVATNAQAAIQVLDQKSVDCIIVEPFMSAHNGVEFLHELRSYTDFATIPVVIYSSHAEVVQMISAPLQVQFGVKGILLKSKTSLQQLLTVVVSTQDAA